MIVELHEHQSRVVELPDATARRLGDLARGALDVVPDRSPGRWRLTAGSHVGSVSLGQTQVLVRSKIPAENVFLFLEVGLPASAWRAEAFDYAVSGDLLPAVLSFFSRTVETTLGTGLLRSYRGRRERLVTLRGRIDIPAQVARAGLASPVDCRFDDFTADVDENRFLKAAIRVALRTPRLPAVDRRRLLQALVSLEEVGDVVVRPHDLDRIVTTRLNAHYVPALRLARLVLENLSLVDIHGAYAASAFMVDMNALFERFLTGRLTDALRGRFQVAAQGTIHLDRGHRIPLRPDLQFRRHGMSVYVADIKYKLSEDAKGRPEDYYQLLAYTTALGLGEGVLIYCRGAEDEVGSTAILARTGTHLHLRAIDASGSPDAVAREIEKLAEWIADRAMAPLRRPETDHPGHGRAAALRGR
jgi:5-methylcytosine-specific restriction enzyme subunit McrC